MMPSKYESRVLVRWPASKNPFDRSSEWERVRNAPLALATLAQHYAEPLAVIQGRLERGERLKTPAYEYRLLEVQRA